MLPSLFVFLTPGLLVAPAYAAPHADPLAAHVTIYRDHYGVPRIVGDSEPAAFFGSAYAQAENHLERMMLQCRDAQRRRAAPALR